MGAFGCVWEAPRVVGQRRGWGWMETRDRAHNRAIGKKVKSEVKKWTKGGTGGGRKEYLVLLVGGSRRATKYEECFDRC